MKDLVSRCPIEEAMRLLSGRWPTLLLYYLKEGTKRFSDLKRDNPAAVAPHADAGAAQARRGRHRAADGASGYPLRVDYDLTPAGLRLVPLIDALGDWWQELSRPQSAHVEEHSRRPSGPMLAFVCTRDVNGTRMSNSLH